MPSSLVVLVTGVLLVKDGNWDWDEWFVVLGLVGWAVVSFTAFGYLSRSREPHRHAHRHRGAES